MLFTLEAFGLGGWTCISNQLRKNGTNQEKQYILHAEITSCKLFCLLFTRVFEIHLKSHKTRSYLSFTSKLVCEYSNGGKSKLVNREESS